MANRMLYPISGARRCGIVTLMGRLDIAADASVAATSSFVGGTFTKTGIGQYTLTLDETYVGGLSACLTLEAATPVDLVPQILSRTTSTVVFSLLAGATATEPSAVCSVQVLVHAKNSSITP